MFVAPDSAANFAAMVINTLANMIFEVGKYNPCLCKHASMDVRLFHHGDDFVRERSAVVCEKTERGIDREGVRSARWSEGGLKDTGFTRHQWKHG